MCHSSLIQFRFKSKIENWFNFRLSLFSIIKIRKCPIENFSFFFPFGRILKHNLYFCFNPIKNEEKNWNWAAFAFPTMLQSVTWLNFSVFGGSLKIKNWKLQSIFNFCFRSKHSKSLTKLTKREGEGVHSQGNFLPPAPSPHGQVRFFS